MRTVSIIKIAKSHKLRRFARRWIFHLVVVVIVLGAGFFVYILSTLPNSSDLAARVVEESTKIFDREGGLLYEVHGEVKRTRVDFGQISEDTKHATVAIEDKDFYKHRGLSIRGIARSVIMNILALRKSQGGSTITQQLIKNALLDNEKRWTRKFKEALLAVQVETRFSKDEILGLYLNEVPYGRNAYGIQSAAQSYFGKEAKQLNLAESAYLAALPQATSFYNPFGQNRKALDARKDKILQSMEDQGYISSEQKLTAQNEQVKFLPPQATIRAPHFVLYVQDYLTTHYGETTARTGGLQVYTTLDPKLQEIAERVVREGGEKNLARGAHNAAFVAIDPKTGQILSMVGSRDYFGKVEPDGCKPGDTCKFEPNFNTTLSARQPGSSFKPFAYMTAFGRYFKYSPASLLLDVETNFGTYGGKNYIPSNYNGHEYGPLSIRQALGGSLNIPAVKIVSLVGVERVTDTARQLGITSPMKDCGLSLVLGGCEVRLLDHTAAFATIANGGVRNKPVSILKIVDSGGKELESFKEDGERVVDEQAAFLVTDILRDADSRRFIFGAGNNMVVSGRTTAGKTGTTQNWRDGWMMGFTSSLAAGVWVGNNDGSFMNKGADGSVVAAPIWKAFLTEALKNYPEEPFVPPDGIERIEVDALSGKLPGPYTTNKKTEVFASYALPRDVDDTHVAVVIDARTGAPLPELVFTDEYPAEFRQTKVYTVLHSERPDNANWEDAVREWAIENGYEYPPGGYVVLPPPSESGNGSQGGESAGMESSQTVISSPQDGVVFLSGDIPVSVFASGNLSKLEVLLDGALIKVIGTPPFAASFQTTVSGGEHTLALRAIGLGGTLAESFVKFTVATEDELVIKKPEYDSSSNELILFSSSQKKYPSVAFYLVNSKTNKSRLLGLALPESQTDGSYLYESSWQNPSVGQQILFAKSGDVTSAKITFDVPDIN